MQPNKAHNGWGKMMISKRGKKNQGERREKGEKRKRRGKISVQNSVWEKNPGRIYIPGKAFIS